jgi:hypothetical protein
VPPQPRPPLRLATRADDRIVVLGCENCDETVELGTADATFAADVQAFFEKHARSCIDPS